MARATITSKGQVTIPARVRAALGVEAGDQLDFLELERGQFAIIPVTHSLQELSGLYKGRRRKAATIDEMNAAIAKEAARSR